MARPIIDPNTKTLSRESNTVEVLSKETEALSLIVLSFMVSSLALASLQLVTFTIPWLKKTLKSEVQETLLYTSCRTKSTYITSTMMAL